MATTKINSTKPVTQPSLTSLVAGLGKSPTKKSAAKTYPIVPESPEVVGMVDEFCRLHAISKGVEGALKTVKAQLNAVAPKPYFESQEGQHTPASMVLAKGTELNEASVTFTSRYGVGDLEAVKEVVGDEVFAKYFYEKLSIAVDGDKVTDTVDERTGKVKMTAADKRVALIQGMVELFQKYDAMEALAAKVVVTPRNDEDGVSFHQERHTALTADQNLALHEILPCVSQVKVRSSNPVMEEKAPKARQSVSKTAMKVLAGAGK